MSLATTLRESRKREAMDVIANTAVDLFTREGYEATSVEAIAEAAGCSPRTFYRYFGTKEDVMFYDLSPIIDELDDTISGHLSEGIGPWAAVSETFLELIGRFEMNDEALPTRRMNLWLSEPALRTRYMQYIIDAEQAVARALHRHLGSTPEEDDLPELIAVAATGAYRVTIITHHPTGMGELTKHLRKALAKIGDGIARFDRSRRGESARRKKPKGTGKRQKVR